MYENQADKKWATIVSFIYQLSYSTQFIQSDTKLGIGVKVSL